MSGIRVNANLGQQCDGCGSFHLAERVFATVTVGVFDTQLNRHRVFNICANGARMNLYCAERLNDKLAFSLRSAA